MKPTVIIIVGFLTALLSGCVTGRTVEIVVQRIEVTAAHSSSGITTADAEALFRRVATELGFEVQGPTYVSAQRTEFHAVSAARPKKELAMYVEDQVVKFEVATWSGSVSEIDEIRALAKHFTDSLDMSAVPYRSAIINRMGPS